MYILVTMDDEGNIEDGELTRVWRPPPSSYKLQDRDTGPEDDDENDGKSGGSGRRAIGDGEMLSYVGVKTKHR